MNEGLSKVFSTVLGPAMAMFVRNPVHSVWLAIVSFSLFVALIPVLMIVLSPVITVVGLKRLYNARNSFGKRW